jgi:hypothetical protein
MLLVFRLSNKMQIKINSIIIKFLTKNKQTNSVVLSPPANYTD